MFKYFAAAAVGLAALLGFSPAEATGLRCDSCVTDADFRMAAEGRNRSGTFHVYNVRTNTIQSWRVPAGGGVISSAQYSNRASGSPIRVNSPDVAIDELNRAHRVYVIGNGTLRPIFNVPASHQRIPATVGRTAYDVLYDRNLRGQIEAQVGSTSFISSVTSENLLTAMADLVGIATSLLGLRDQTAMVIRYVLDDGSYIDIEVKLDETVGTVLENTAKTAGNQVIPYKLEDVQGTWLALPGDDLSAMAGHFRRLGASVTSTPAGARITGIVCVPGRCDVQFVTE